MKLIEQLVEYLTRQPGQLSQAQLQKLVDDRFLEGDWIYKVQYANYSRKELEQELQKIQDTLELALEEQFPQWELIDELSDREAVLISRLKNR